MLDFLRLLSPNHGDALRPAAPLRRMSAATQWGEQAATPMLAPVDEALPAHAQPPPPPPVAGDTSAIATEPTGSAARPMRPSAAALPTLAPATGDAASDAYESPSPLRGTQAPQMPARAAAAASHRTIAATLTAPHDAAEYAPSPAIAARAPSAIRAVSVASNAPLSASVVARLSADAPAAPPALHISIDRIEVRAARPASKPAAAAPRAVPAPQPLGDYLRGKARQP